ncbi:MAG: hypothetical protein RL508_70 [Actinomycetota bacterium]|jgi:predicted metal-dependent phosphoesterase TrpH
MAIPKLRSDLRIDMHTHSLRSDGRGEPTQVMHEAAAAGLDVVALTDHDTVAGWQEGHDVAVQLGLGFIPGIELTTRAQGQGDSRFTVHLLAYLPDPNHQELRAVLAESVASRLVRLQQITELLADDYDISWDNVLEVLADGKVAGRPAVADAMIRRGIFDAREPFFDIVKPGAKYYVPNRGVPDTLTAIDLVRRAGGVPVIAHPMARGRGPKPGEAMPREHFLGLIEAGLAGFETGHRDVSPHVADWLGGLAEEFDLLVTGSSDYHGTGKPNRLGENTTSSQALSSILNQAKSLQSGAATIPWHLPASMVSN